jgi:catechol 2,3-dioxygenase-like lactoylglutathione lyase family enzyme
MKLLHIGLTSRSEKSSDRFFGELLGLKKLELKTVSAALSQAIFNVNADLKIVNYTGDHVHFEIFIGAPGNGGTAQIPHVCLGVKDLAAFIEKCNSLNERVLQVPRGESLLTFVRDGDGNLFEIKERKTE